MSDPISVAHLGLNVYFWGAEEQSRLLVECLAPALDDLRRQGLVNRFWFDRFGARGPHVFGVLTVADGASPEVARRLSESLDPYLENHPSSVTLSPEEIAARHDECRGKTLCEADRYPGHATNNSYCLFEHGSRGYPFSLSAGLPAEDELWSLLDESTSWSIRQLARGAGTGAAIRWLAALARELRSLEPRAESYWRYHATTLLTVLVERLATDEQSVLAELPRWIGERNLAAFSRIWAEEEEPPGFRASFRALLEIVLLTGTSRRPWALLREIVHTQLKQLGLPVSRHVPAVLFAWHDSLLASVALPSQGGEPGLRP